MKNFTLSKPKFKNWLETTDRTYVGMSSKPHCCPIANFIKDEYGHSPLVGRMDVRLNCNDTDTCYDLPVWARAFIQRVDLQGGDYYAHKRITRKKALELL